MSIKVWYLALTIFLIITFSGVGNALGPVMIISPIDPEYMYPTTPTAPKVYVPPGLNVEETHNLLIGGISQDPNTAENSNYIKFADDNNAVYVPTYYSGSKVSDVVAVGMASRKLCLEISENGLARDELNDHDYDTIFAYSGGTVSAVTAIDKQGVKAEKLVLISPMGALESQEDYDRMIQRILAKGVKIEVWQSKLDQLSVVGFQQVRFDKGADLNIMVHNADDLNSEGEGAHIELFSYAASRISSGTAASDVLDPSISEWEPTPVTSSDKPMLQLSGSKLTDWEQTSSQSSSGLDGWGGYPVGYPEEKKVFPADVPESYSQDHPEQESDLFGAVVP